MDKKAELLNKLSSKPHPRNFTVRELDQLMRMCGCIKFESRRGSGIGYLYPPTNQKVQFDRPHPGNELYLYHVKKVIRFLESVHVLEEDNDAETNGV